MGADEFSGLRAIVTGAGAGIGLAVCQLLAERGAQVVGLDLNPAALQAPLCGLVCDIGDDAAVLAAVAQAAHCLGGIDILINNAGIGALGDVTANPDAQWHHVLDINVVGLVRVTRAALPWLRNSRCAAIVNTASAVGQIGLPNRALYSASKGAVIALTRAMAADFVQVPIRVNCVTPGVVDTPWQERALAAAADRDALHAQLRNFQPNGHIVAAQEVARAIAFLASPRSPGTTGIVLPIDGGLQGVYAMAGSSTLAHQRH